MKKIATILISFWIVYHGLGIVLMPSPQSILVDLHGKYFRSYLNQLGMNTTWNLFSPDPAQALYAQVQLIHPKYETGEKTILFPPTGHGRMYNPADQRSFYFFRYLMLDMNRVEEFLIPAYCKSAELPREVWIQVHRLQIPSLKELQIEGDPFDSHSVMNFEKQWYCQNEEDDSDE